MPLDILKAKIKDKYLNPDGADFWFVFGDERVPGHKFVLETMSPWLNTMFNGSLPVKNEINMSEYDITVEAFKEFLRFLYTEEVNFTMDNIEEIINLAKLSLIEEFFVECENFLLKSLTIENMVFGYKLAIKYDANRLKNHCEDEIGLYADKVLKFPTFLDFSYEFLKTILKCDTLVCDEKDIFDACIDWAKAACERKGQNPLLPENIRMQLKDSIYQIRFNSMTKEEAADCISSFRRLFTNAELEEIICMIGRKMEFQMKKFNWTTRIRRLQQKNKGELECSRFKFRNYVFPYIFSYIYPSMWSFYVSHDYNLVEQTTFTSNKMLMLNGFTCEGFESNRGWNPALAIPYLVNIRIFKINSNDDNDIDELFNQQITLNFTEKRKYVQYLSKKVHVKLEPAILIRPKRKYTIGIKFQANANIRNHCSLKSSARVDHNIVIEFDGKRGAISSLNISRVDKENFFKKILRNPNMYLMLIVFSFLIWLYFNLKEEEEEAPSWKTFINIWHY